MKSRILELPPLFADQLRTSAILLAKFSFDDVKHASYFEAIVEKLLDETYERRRDETLPERAIIVVQFDGLIPDVKNVVEHFSKFASCLQDRNPNNAIATVCLDRWKISTSIIPSIKESSIISEDVLVDALRSSIFHQMVISSGSLYQAPSGHYFRMPSGGYSSHFLRVGNIQSNRDNLDELSFWLAPHLYNFDLIISESWTISTLVYHLSRYLERYRVLQEEKRGIYRILQKPKFLIKEKLGVAEAAYFSTNHGTPDARYSDIHSTLSNNKEKLKNVAIIHSARFSGREQLNVRKALNLSNASIGRSDSYVLFDLSNSPIDKKYIYAPRFEDKTIEISTPSAEESFQTIDINRKTFFPAINNNGIRGILRSKHVEPVKSFIERYSGSQIFKVHRDTKDSPIHGARHHAYYIDFTNLIEHEVFQSRLDEKLNTIDINSVGALIFQSTPNNRRFLDSIRSRFTDLEIIELRNYDLEALDTINSEKIRSIPIDKSILIIESVVVTGTTLGKISHFFREFNDLSLIYLCGVVRPDRKKKTENTFRIQVGAHDHGEHKFVYVDDVVLPNWHGSDCPWCHETRVFSESSLRDLDSNDLAMRRLRDRRAFLRSGADIGLTHNVFLSALEGERQLQLGDNSVLLNVGEVNRFRRDAGKPELSPTDVSEADVAVCLAAIGQVWREELFLSFVEGTLDNSLDSEIPTLATAPVFDRLRDDAVTGRTMFTDPIIRAALWRAFRNSELLPRPSGEEADFRDFVESVIGSDGIGPNDRQIRDELLLLLGSSDFPYGDIVGSGGVNTELFQLANLSKKK